MDKEAVRFVDRIMCGEIKVIDNHKVYLKHLMSVSTLLCGCILISVTYIFGVRSDTVRDLLNIMAFSLVVFSFALFIAARKDVEYNTVELGGAEGVVLSMELVSYMDGNRILSLKIKDSITGEDRMYPFRETLLTDVNIGDNVYVFTTYNNASKVSSNTLFKGEQYYLTDEDCDIIRNGIVVNSFGIKSSKGKNKKHVG